MNIDLLIRSDIKAVHELPKLTGRLSDEQYNILLYCEETDTYGPCIVCDIGDFNNLMRYELEYKMPDHRDYSRCKFKVQVFPWNNIEEAREWTTTELKYLRPVFGEDELCRSSHEYDIALANAKRFPGKVLNSKGTELEITQMNIDYLILEKGIKPTYPNMSVLARVKQNLGIDI